MIPGDHYRILNAIVNVLNLKNIIEIGTATGLSALAMKEGNKDTYIHTYDLIQWNKYPSGTHFTRDNMQNINQVIGDLSQLDFFEKNFKILDNADFIFVDGPKDGVFEYKMIDLFKKLSKKESKYLFFDDIRFMNMIDLWVSISSPKIDLTSFGHWSGSGLVDISNGLHTE